MKWILYRIDQKGVVCGVIPESLGPSGGILAGRGVVVFGARALSVKNLQDVIDATRPARPPDYRRLAADLEKAGETFIPYHRPCRAETLNKLARGVPTGKRPARAGDHLRGNPS